MDAISTGAPLTSSVAAVAFPSAGLGGALGALGTANPQPVPESMLQHWSQPSPTGTPEMKPASVDPDVDKLLEAVGSVGFSLSDEVDAETEQLGI